MASGRGAVWCASGPPVFFLAVIQIIMCTVAVDAQSPGEPEVSQCDVPDIDECASAPCTNGAACRDSLVDAAIPHRQYRCVCRSGFANGTCAVDWLAAVPQYDGLCTVAAGNCDVELDDALTTSIRASARPAATQACTGYV